MNFRKTILLALVLGAALFYVYRIEKPKQEAAKKKGMIFSDLDASGVDQIVIDRAPSGESPATRVVIINTKPNVAATPTAAAVEEDPFASSELPARESGWQLEAFPTEGIDSVAISSLMTALQGLKLDEPISPEEAGSDLSPFGLHNPPLTISVKQKTGEVKNLKFGVENEYFAKRFLSIEGDRQLYLVPPALYGAAEKSLFDFRNKTPIDFREGEVVEFEVASPKGRLKVTRKSDNDWVLGSDRPLKASPLAARSLLVAMKNLRVSEFFDGTSDVTPYGLDRPAVTVTIKFSPQSQRQPLVLRFAEKSEGAGEVFAISGQSTTVWKSTQFRTDDLSKSEFDLREKELFRFDPSQVKRVEFSGHGRQAISLVREGENWKVDDKVGDGVFIEQVLFNLMELTATSFPDGGDGGFSQPELQVAVTTTTDLGNSRTQVLLVGAEKSAGEFFARIGESGELFTISAESLKKIRPAREALLKPTPGA
jgi:Domain of unknown function (DUF4340)